MNKIKFIEDVHARLAYQYINMKRKQLRTNAHIFFNRMYQNKNSIPNYAKINIKNTSKAVEQTQGQTTKLRINNEIKYV
jgi:hypothetical protein